MLANRTASVTDSGLTTSYAYDGDGVRLAATSWASAVDYLWDGNAGLPQLALERSGGTVARSYLYGDGPVSTSTGGVSSYLHRDAIGSVASVTSAAGDLAWAYSYEPFGTTRSATRNDPAAPDNPIGFAGEYLDQTGLYHLRARQYDATTGRFTATDPLTPALTRPYVSAYVYADNRPTVLIDPSGLNGVWGPRIEPAGPTVDRCDPRRESWDPSWQQPWDCDALLALIQRGRNKVGVAGLVEGGVACAGAGKLAIMQTQSWPRMPVLLVARGLWIGGACAGAGVAAAITGTDPYNSIPGHVPR